MCTLRIYTGCPAYCPTNGPKTQRCLCVPMRLGHVRPRHAETVGHFWHAYGACAFPLGLTDSRKIGPGCRTTEGRRVMLCLWCQVRNNQVPKPRAMVEDILTRVTLLDAELARYTGSCGGASGGVTPRTGGAAPAADAERPQLEYPRPAGGHVQPTETPQVTCTRHATFMMHRLSFLRLWLFFND